MIYIFVLFPFLILFFVLIYRIKTENVLRMSFWLFFSYGFLLITHLFSGIKYNSGSVISILPYFLLCLILVVFGELLGIRVKTDNVRAFSINNKLISILSIVGSIVLTIDTFRLNQINFGLRIEDQSLSAIGVIGTVFSSLGIISWLSNFYVYRLHGMKISVFSYLALISYVISDILSAGRQSLLIIVLSTLIIFIWSTRKVKELNFLVVEKNDFKRKPKLWGLIVIAIAIVSYFLVISTVRSQILNIDNKIDNFDTWFNAKTSKSTIEFTKSLGPFSDIYIETLYYYSHELIRLDIFFDYYDYHPLFGLEQLPYLERRLQWLFGKQSEYSWQVVESAIEGKGKFSCHTWGTFITNMIVDFGRFGAPFACLIVGFFSGVSFNIFKNNQNVLTVIRQVLICAGVVFSIQFSPFAQLAWAFPLFLSSFVKLKY